jgi:RNA polymerase sigma factor (sigma-70 family)
MPDVFPDTPVSLLSCIEGRRGGMPYQDAWRSFFDLYHGPIRAAALGTFGRYNWNQVPEDLLEEVIADVVVSFFKAEFSYDPERGRFRNYLRQLTAWRIMDKLGKLPATPSTQLESVSEADLADPIDSHQPAGELDCKEQDIYRAALFATMLEDVRNRVSPQTFLMFEMTKVQGHDPAAVAKQFGVKRNVVDNATHRVIGKLRELATQPEYRKEYLG